MSIKLLLSASLVLASLTVSVGPAFCAGGTNDAENQAYLAILVAAQNGNNQSQSSGGQGQTNSGGGGGGGGGDRRP